MELRHLRYFVAVAEEENVTRAAERLHVSQPPLSRQIRDLEEELGVSLFERTAKTVKLTALGRIFLKEARAVLERSHAAVRAVHEAAGIQQKELHVGYAPTLTVELLPDALRRFQSSFPQVKVVLHDLNSEEMLSGLRQGRLHVALLARPGRSAGRGFTFEKLREYEMCVAMSPSHRLARRRVVEIDDLKEERLIGYARAGYPEYHEDLGRYFGGTGKNAGKASPIREEHESVSSLVAAVESGRGIALVASALSAVAGARLTLLPLRPRAMLVSVGAAWRGQKPTQWAERFLESFRRGQEERKAEIRSSPVKPKKSRS